MSLQSHILKQVTLNVMFSVINWCHSVRFITHLITETNNLPFPYAFLILYISGLERENSKPDISISMYINIWGIIWVCVGLTCCVCHIDFTRGKVIYQNYGCQTPCINNKATQPSFIQDCIYTLSSIDKWFLLCSPYLSLHSFKKHTYKYAPTLTMPAVSK